MSIIVYGLNHKTAPVEIREALSFDDEGCIQVNEQLMTQDWLRESVVLSTCNRTEIYGVIGNHSQLNGELPRFLSRFITGEKILPEDLFYYKKNENAVKQLLSVASSLDSLVIGEVQILGQVKNAYRLAAEQSSTGLILNKLFHCAFRAGKRVRNETRIGAGAISVASVAVDLAKKIFDDFSEKKAVLVGAGEMAAQTVEHLKGQGAKNIDIINRTFKNAKKLAAQLGVNAAPYDRLIDLILRADIVVASTSAKKPILNSTAISTIMEQRKNRPLLLIDIAVPRNVDPDAKQIYNTYLYDIDDLNVIVEQNLGARKNEIPKARKIIDEEVKNFMKWYYTLPARNTIQDIQLHFEQIRKKEIHRNKKYFDESDWEQMEKFSKSLMKKFLHSPIMRLKSCSETENLCESCTVKEVFGVEDE